MQILTISEYEAGQRLDKYLGRYLALAPKSFIYKMLRKKNIVLNEKKAMGNEKLQQKDQIKLYLARETIDKFSKAIMDDYSKNEIQSEEDKSPVRVIYEDGDIIILNKPAGILSQKAKADDVSMNEYLIRYLIKSEQMNAERLKTFHPAVCNRLDRNTSGILLAGKTIQGLQELSAGLKERSVKKEYLCLVAGQVKEAHIKGHLQKLEKCNKVIISDQASKEGVPIETAYRPLCYNERVTLLLVHLITGKTHQIRSHLASMGHPVIGDWKYGQRGINQAFRREYGLEHQLLHAYRITLGEARTFEAKVPELFAAILKGEYLEDWQHEKNNNA